MRLSTFIKRAGDRPKAVFGARSGATALEFALVAPIFFLILFAIIEAGAVYIGEATLQFGTNDMARQIRTGQIQLGNIGKTEFRNMLCAKISPFLACDDNLQVDVQSYSDFVAADFAAPVDANGNLNPSLNNYNPGTACQVVLMRNFYKWNVQTPFFTPFLVNLSGDNHLISAAAAFRNEPYSTGVSGCS